MDIAFFDIETTDLAADVGTILCACVKPLGGPVVTLEASNNLKPLARSDKKLVVDLIDKLAEFDLVVSYYGRYFDVPYVRSRAVLHRVHRPISFLHLDLHLTTKQGLRLSNNRLVTCEKFLGLQNEKTPLTRKVWKEAELGNAKSMRHILTHCAADVKVLEEYYAAMVPHVKNIGRILL